MVTPTFAAGLGVLVAAGLAANMPRTVLHFSSPVPGIQCSAGVCATEEPNSGTLASARPGVHIAPASPGRSGSTSAGSHVAGQRGGHPGHSSGAAARVTVSYQLTHQWQGGFIDQISITGMDARRSSWSLALGYPGARVTNVLGVQWQATSPDAGVAEGYGDPESGGAGAPGGPGSQHGDGGSSWAQFTIVLDGPPMAPVGCDFDGTPCTFRQATQP